MSQIDGSERTEQKGTSAARISVAEHETRL